MADYSALKATIDASINTNGQQAITGAILNDVLNEMVDVLGEGYTFLGVATPTTNPTTPEGKAYYLAGAAGTYSNFGNIVVNDDEVALLVWNGTAWSKVVSPAASKEEVRLLVQKVDSINLGTEIQPTEAGKYANLSSASIGSQYTLSITSFPSFAYWVIPCSEGQTFILTTIANTAAAKAYAVLDASGIVLDLQQWKVTNLYLTIPSGGKTLIINSRTNEGDAYSIVNPIGVIDDLAESLTDKINESTTQLEQEFKPKNPNNITTIPWIDGTFVNIYGAEGQNTAYACTDFIEINDYKYFIYRGNSIFQCSQVAFFREDRSFISAIPQASQSTYSSKEFILMPEDCPQGAKYVRFSTFKNGNNLFTPIVIQCDPTFKDVQNPKRLSTKSIHFIGDSVMLGRAAVESVRSMPYFLQNKYSLMCENHAAGGAILTSSSLHYARIYDQLTSIPANADVIIMQGGLNGIAKEATSSAPWGWGSISDGFEDNFSTILQIPCLEAMCKYVVTRWPNKKYGFIINYDISSYAYWQEKAALIKQVLDKWGIPYLDWRHSGVNLASVANREKYGIDASTLYPAYDATSTYNADDRVIYDGKVYKANQAITTPEEFTPAHWDEVSSSLYDGWHCNALAYERLADITYSWLSSL